MNEQPPRKKYLSKAQSSELDMQTNDKVNHQKFPHADKQQAIGPVEENFEVHDEENKQEDGNENHNESSQDNHAPSEQTANAIERFDDIVSGRFDVEQEKENTAPLKRVLRPQADTPKLHKILAQKGMGSRLEMEQLIVEGRITVNNEPAHIGQRIQFGDQVRINGELTHLRIEPPAARLLAYHKPAGEVVTHDDPQNRPTVFRKLPKVAHGKWQSVGRLDLNTEGLLLFTNSGELANHLMHPRFGLEREYAVRVLGALSSEEKARLLEGIQLDDGMAKFSSIEEGGGEGANCWYRVVIQEGRNREVRRMMEKLGHAVSRLIRIRYGVVQLPIGLKRGVWVELSEGEVHAVQKSLGFPFRQKRASTENASGRSSARRSPDRSAGRSLVKSTDRSVGGRSFGRPYARSSDQPFTRESSHGTGFFGKKPLASFEKDRSERFGDHNPNSASDRRYGQNVNGYKSDRIQGNQGAKGPDPMRTSMGYIGSNSYRESQARGQSRGQGFGGQGRNQDGQSRGQGSEQGRSVRGQGYSQGSRARRGRDDGGGASH